MSNHQPGCSERNDLNSVKSRVAIIIYSCRNHLFIDIDPSEVLILGTSARLVKGSLVNIFKCFVWTRSTFVMVFVIRK